MFDFSVLSNMHKKTLEDKARQHIFALKLDQWRREAELALDELEAKNDQASH